MPDLEPFLRFWRALDGLLERVERTWWGAVVTDRRLPLVHDVNYARVETRDPDLTLAEVEVSLRPAIERSGAAHRHIVVFHHESQARLIVELEARRDRVSWDAVMQYRGPLPQRGNAAMVEELRDPDEAFWERHRVSLAEFGIGDPRAVDQLVRLEREILLPAKRWFVVREKGEIAALGSLAILEGIGYIDHVATFPRARRRGFAGAIVTRMVEESEAAGVDCVYLLADPGKPHVLGLYERRGFGVAGRLASSLGPAAPR